MKKYGKMGEKHTLWAFFGDMYRYTLNMYRYMLGSGHFRLTCTGTGQGCQSGAMCKPIPASVLIIE